MTRRFSSIAAAGAFVLLAAACTAGNGSSDAPSAIDTNASHAPVTISMWIPFTGREFGDVKKAFAAFEDTYPWITVDLTYGYGEDDGKVLAAIRSGTPPDAVMSWSLDSVGKFCDSAAWQDLTPFINQTGDAGLDMSQFPEAVSGYTSFGGSQCALPFLTDVTGLYYNKDMLAAAGYTEPPKTLSELFEMSKKLTVKNPDGSIKVAGFNPWFGQYEFTPLDLGITFGADYYNEEGTAAAIASDPDWKAMFEWQKQFVDFFGADNLRKFVAGSQDEWGEHNDFQIGRVAMQLDGEWRTANIENEAPDLNYGTAPFPVLDGHEDEYGFGRLGGTIMGIPKGAPHAAEAWLLVKFLATDTDTLVTAANLLRNVPTTFESLAAPELDVTPQFQTFLDIFAHPGSHWKQVSVLGVADQDAVEAFADDWQAGDATDLNAGLAQTATRLDDLLAQAGI
jgi:multiple sugar transport system substrate-binding protein